MAQLLRGSASAEPAVAGLRYFDRGPDTGGTSRRNNAAYNLGRVLSGQAALSASRFAALLVVARYVTPSEFDVCAIYTSSSLVVGNLCELGINISCLKFAANAHGPEWLRTVSRFLMLRLALTTLTVSSVALLAPVISTHLLKHPTYAEAIRLACASSAIASISSFSLMLLQSRLDFRRVARQSLAGAVLQVLPLMLVLGSGHWGLASLWAGDVLSCGWIVAANSNLLVQVVQALRQPGSRPPWKLIATFANWITWSTLIGSVQNYIPSIALSRWATVSALGIYTLGLSLSGGFALLINAASTVLLPEAVAATTAKQRYRYVKSYLPVAGTVAVLLLLPTWVGGRLAVPLFPPAMAQAVRVFQLLATAQFVLLD